MQIKFNIGHKIYFLLAISFVGVLAIVAIAAHQLSTSLVDQKRIELKHLTDLAWGIVNEEHGKVRRDGVPVETAQKSAAQRIAVSKRQHLRAARVTARLSVLDQHPTAAAVQQQHFDPRPRHLVHHSEHSLQYEPIGHRITAQFVGGSCR